YPGFGRTGGGFAGGVGFGNARSFGSVAGGGSYYRRNNYNPYYYNYNYPNPNQKKGTTKLIDW
ncbi:hypothetical protein BLA29_012633, partial [Euroglyphus maynei]